MDLRSIYVSNGVSVAILLILRYISRAKILRDRTEDRVFSFLVYGVMLGSVMEVASYMLDGHAFTGARVLNYVINTYLFSANMLLPFGLLVYVDLCLYGNASRIVKRYKPQIIVGAAMIALNIVNFFVPITYYINEQNVYERRPVSYVYYAAIVYFCVSIILLLQKYKKENGARAFFNFSLFLIPMIGGIGLQFLFYGLSLAWLSSALGLVGLFMMQQNEMAYIDSLVATYNRRYMDHLLSAWFSRGRNFAGIMLDIDGFKSINDTFGHSEGDNALKTLTKILKQCCRSNERVFRFAGDEFVVLKLTDDPKDLEEYMQRVNERVDEFNAGSTSYILSLSYSVGFFLDGTIDSFMKELDKKMYAMKELHHKNGVNVVRETAQNVHPQVGDTGNIRKP